MPNSYWPDGFRIESNSRFASLQEGRNIFRIIGTPLIGFTANVETPDGDKKKFSRNFSDFVGDKIVGKFSKSAVPFILFPVWDYQVNAVKLLEIKQKTIADGLQAKINDEKWGDPTRYDICITKEKGARTTYSVTPYPPEPLKQEIQDQIGGMVFDLEALFTGGDVFRSGPVQTPDASAEQNQKIKDALGDDVTIEDVPF